MATRKPAAEPKGRRVDARRVVTYDLTEEERARAILAAQADSRSLSQWVAWLIRKELTRKGL